VLRPSQGPVGTIVRFAGHLSPAQLGRLPHGTPNIGLGTVIGPCAFSVGLTDAHSQVDRRTGNVTGSFRVGSTGICQSGPAQRRVRAGTYELDYGCVSCFAGIFRVTNSATVVHTLPSLGPPLELLALS
jgi:hypothetical protein